MMNRKPTHWRWSIVGASLTLLALGLFAPTSALAGCDHLGERPSIGGDLVGFGLFSSDLARIPGPPQAPRPKPCNGPSCSKNPAQPLAPAVLPRFDDDSRALVLPPEPSLGLESGRLIVIDDAISPILLPSAIFHPPRLAR
jgi:hypothetical protein